MCVLNKERVESQMMIAGVDHNIIDLQFGRGFTDRVLNGRKVTVDEGRRLCKNLKCNLEYLKGADIIDANDDSDEIYFEISSSILKQRRTALGYSQKALSELMANKSPTYFSKLESDNHTGRVRKTTLQGLAYYLRCSEEYLQGHGNGIGTPPVELPDSIRNKRITCKLQWEVVNRKIAQLHISPTKLARRVGMPRAVITRGKVDGGEVPVCVANAIAGVFGMDVREISFAYNRPDLLEEERNNTSMLEQVLQIAKSNISPVEKEVNSSPFNAREMSPNHTAPTSMLPAAEQQATPQGCISFANLAAVAKIGETNPEVFDLMLQIAELSPEQIKSVASTIDLLVKGMIVS